MDCRLSSLAGSIAKCLFLATVWELWYCRNKARYDNLPMHSRHILRRIMFAVRPIIHALKPKGRDLSLLQRHLLASWGLSPPPAYQAPPKLIRWLAPPTGRLKLNVDGAFKHGMGITGGGGVVHSSGGYFICAFAASYQRVHSSLEAEALALRDGLLLCHSNGFSSVAVESDSLVLVKTVTVCYSRPWCLTYILHEIAALSQLLQASFSHIYREANQVADCLASLGCGLTPSLSIFPSWPDLPTIVKGPFRLDKEGFPSIRP